MARIRTIKPDFPHSESMGRVSRDARLLFILLWTVADDAGRLRGNSRMLASLLFPYDDDARRLIDKWIEELVHEKSIVVYQVDGHTYVQICNWLIHQKIDKPSASKIPPPEENSSLVARIREDSPNGREDSSEEWKGRERKGEEGKGKEKRREESSTFGLRQMLETCPGLTEQEAKDYQAVRKAKKAGNVSETAWRAIEKESIKAGIAFDEAVRKCIARNWVGFEADWLKPPPTQAKPGGAVDFREKRKAEEDAIWEQYMKPDQAQQVGDFIEGEFTSGQ